MRYYFGIQMSGHCNYLELVYLGEGDKKEIKNRNKKILGFYPCTQEALLSAKKYFDYDYKERSEDDFVVEWTTDFCKIPKKLKKPQYF